MKAKKLTSLIMSAILMLNISAINANAYPSADEEGANEPWYTFEELLEMSEDEIKSISDDYTIIYHEALNLYYNNMVYYHPMQCNGEYCYLFFIDYWDDEYNEETALNVLQLPEELFTVIDARDEVFRYDIATKVIDLDFNEANYGTAELYLPVEYKDYTSRQLAIAYLITLYFNPEVERSIDEQMAGGVQLLKGDSDCDGELSVNDASMALQMYSDEAAGTEIYSSDYKYTLQQVGYADINEDFSVDLSDAAEILTSYSETAADIQ